MSWFDGFLAIPTISIKTKPNFNAFFSYPEILIPLLNKLNEKGEGFEIERNDFEVTVDATNGFTYNFLQEKINIGFKYAIDPIEEIGKFPRIPDIELKPYSTLLADALNEAKQILSLFTDTKQLQVSKLSIALSLKTDLNSIPPGVESFIDYLARPWDGSLNRCRTMLTTRLNKKSSTSYEDSCIHYISFDKTEEPIELEFSLVWERNAVKNIKSADNQTNKWLENSANTALEYFQAFGEGNISYEQSSIN